jgi:hypothetical protein
MPVKTLIQILSLLKMWTAIKKAFKTIMNRFVFIIRSE